jgi:hypothetical protein
MMLYDKMGQRWDKFVGVFALHLFLNQQLVNFVAYGGWIHDVICPILSVHLAEAQWARGL